MGRLLPAASAAPGGRTGAKGRLLQVKAKRRWIDPLVLNQGRLSKLDPFYKAEIEAFLHQDQTIWLKEISNEK